MDIKSLIDNILSANTGELQNYLEQGGDVNARDEDGKTLLAIASASGLSEVVKVLVEAGVDINASNQDDLAYTSLIESIRSLRNSQVIVSYLLEQGSSIEKGDWRGGTPLLHACIMGDGDMVEFLLEKGANKEAIELTIGATPLSFIALNAKQWGSGVITTTYADGSTETKSDTQYEKHINVFKKLIEQGANIHHVDGRGFSVLHCAAVSGALEFAQLLIEAGTDANIKNANEYTPLHGAVDGGHEAMVKYLLDSGADCNATDTYGFSPLHAAVDIGAEEIVKQLLAAGADKQKKIIKSYNHITEGMTPIDIAQMRGNQQIVTLLEWNSLGK